jgi:hypothetical protein
LSVRQADYVEPHDAILLKHPLEHFVDRGPTAIRLPRLLR